MEGDRVSRKDEIELAMQQARGLRTVCLCFKLFMVLEIFDKSNI